LARAPRLDFPGALHHVIVKGNEAKPIFRDDSDRETYLRILGACPERTGLRVLAYCLMTNHAHFALETGREPLARSMHRLQTLYAQSFNRRYLREGHLFKGRYNALLVQTDAYLLTLIRYIHENPVKAMMCAGPETYSWSSDRFYRWGGGPAWLDTSMALAMLDSRPGDACGGYAAWMSRSETLSYIDVPCHAGLVKGEEGFAGRLFRRKEPELVRRILTPERVAEAVAVVERLSLAQLRGRARSRSLADARAMSAFIGKKYGCTSFAEMARYLARDPTILVKLASRLERRLDHSVELQARIERVLVLLRVREMS
jgi:REP element-mobilizing transposase RayT